MKNKWISVLVCLQLIVLTGCWDRREIEEMGMVVGLAIDKGKKKDEIMLTNQFVNTIKGKKDEPGVSDYYNIKTTGGAMMETVKYVSNLTDNTPYYTHLKVIVISEEVAKSANLMEIINWFLRDQELRRTIQIIIAKGKAEKILKAKLEKRTIPAIELWGMSQNIRETKKMPQFLTLGDMGIQMTGEMSFLAQSVEPLQMGLKMAGAAVISGKKRKLIGWLNEDEMNWANFLVKQRRGKEGGVIKIIDENAKKPLVYYNRNIKRKLEIQKKNGDISFLVKVYTEGYLLEDWSLTENAFENDYLKKVEKILTDELKKQTTQVLHKMQKKLKADVFGFRTQLKNDDFQTWKKLKSDWDNEFSKIPIEVQAEVKIVQFGGKGAKLPKK